MKQIEERISSLDHIRSASNFSNSNYEFCIQKFVFYLNFLSKIGFRENENKNAFNKTQRRNCNNKILLYCFLSLLIKDDIRLDVTHRKNILSSIRPESNEV